MLTFNRQSLKKGGIILRYVKEASNIEQLFKTKNKPTTTIQLRMGCTMGKYLPILISTNQVTY